MPSGKILQELSRYKIGTFAYIIHRHSLLRPDADLGLEVGQGYQDLEAKGLPARAVFNEIVRMVKEDQP